MKSTTTENQVEKNMELDMDIWFISHMRSCIYSLRMARVARNHKWVLLMDGVSHGPTYAIVSYVSKLAT